MSQAQRGALTQRLASCCWLLSEFQASADAFRQAAACAGSASERALLLARASFSYLWNHDYEKTRQFGDQARELAITNDSASAIAFSSMVRDELELVHGRAPGDEA